MNNDLSIEATDFQGGPQLPLTSESMNRNGSATPDKPVQNPTTAAGNRVQALLNLLGPVVLVPIPRGQKGPTLPGWNLATREQMTSPQYLALLESGNIGVLLGAASSRLCSVDIDEDAAVEAFLQLNPGLQNTLRTRGARGANIWIRIRGEYPKLAKLTNREEQGWGEWRADGGQTVIDGLHPCGNPYTRIVDAAPVEVAFADIVWPPELKLPWALEECDQLNEIYGPAFSGGKSIGINQGHFIARYACEHIVLYEPAEDEFYAYNDATGLWEIRSEHRMKTEFGAALRGVADQAEVSAVKFQVTDKLTTALKNSLKGHIELRGAFTRKPPRVIHLQNGMLDLNEDPPMLMPFDPEYYSRNLVPIELDEAAQCPRFQNEVLRQVLDQDDISLFQRWCGSVLLGSNLPQRLMIFQGLERTGKSTLANVIEGIIGQTNLASLRTSLLEDRFELSGFIGKTLLTGKDVDGNFLNQKGAYVIKALCGGDTLDAEIKNGGRVPIRGDFDILVTSNSRLWLKLNGDAGAWRRRLLIIEFNRPRTSRNIPGLAAQLVREEGAGILNFMIEGAVALLQELEEHGDYVLSQAQQNRIERLVSESASVEAFVRTCVLAFEHTNVTTDELVEGYTEFCERRGWHPLPAHEVQHQLPDAMMAIHRAARRNDLQVGLSIHRGYVGFRIDQEGEPHAA